MNDYIDVIQLYNRILLSHEKNEIMPFVAIQMDLEIIMLNEVNQTETNISYDIAYTGYLKKMIQGLPVVAQGK